VVDVVPAARTVLLVTDPAVTTLAAVEQALYDHELIKVKVNEGPESRQEAAEKLSQGTGAELVQLLGRTVLLFKKRAEDSKFEKF